MGVSRDRETYSDCSVQCHSFMAFSASAMMERCFGKAAAVLLLNQPCSNRPMMCPSERRSLVVLQSEFLDRATNISQHLSQQYIFTVRCSTRGEPICNARGIFATASNLHISACWLPFRVLNALSSNPPTSFYHSVCLLCTYRSCGNGC